MASSPASSLSSLSSAQDIEEPSALRLDGAADHDSLELPPAKRRRTSASPRSPGLYGQNIFGTSNPIYDDISDVSSDSEGSVQGSPKALKDLAMPDEDVIAAEQVRICKWEGCELGELANLDELVDHLNNDHVNAAKASKFTCGWSECRATGKTQMSAYALKAHLRSHTKEKPFYCALPECDSSFTRSDALAKHMRTVHSNETAKSLEHYSKNPHAMLAMVDGKDSNTPSRGTPGYPGGTPYGAPSAITASSKPPQRLKLVLNANKSSSSTSNALPHTNGNSTNTNDHPSQPYAPTDPTLPLSPTSRDALFGPLPPDLSFTPSEAALPRASLFRLLRRQLHWATTASTALTHSVTSLESLRRTEFLAKELALENALEATHAVTERSGLISSWAENGVRGVPGQESLQAETVLRDEETEARFWAGRREEGMGVGRMLGGDVEAAGLLPLGGEPWYRGQEWKEKRREMDEARKAAEKDGEGTSGAAGTLGGGGSGTQAQPEEVDDEVDDAALLDDADEADEELEAPEAEADEELGQSEGDEDEEGGDAEAEAMDVDGREREGHGGVRLSSAHGGEGMVV